MPALVPITLAATVGKVILSSLASGQAEEGKSIAGKKSTDSKDSAGGTIDGSTTFAALLAAATAISPVQATTATPVSTATGLKGSANSPKEGQAIAAVGTAKTAGAPALAGATTAASSVKPATPAPTGAAGVQMAASSIRPGSPDQTPAGGKNTASASAPSPVRTAPGTVPSSVLPAEHEQPGVSEAAPSLLHLQTTPLQGGTDAPAIPAASSPSPAAAPPVHAAATPRIEPKSDTLVSAIRPEPQPAAIPPALTIEKGAGRIEPGGLPRSAAAAHQPLHRATEDATQRQDAPADAPPTPTVAASVTGPTAAAPTDPAAGPANAPVADQLAQAFVSHADVARSDGRIDFHLRLEPPQLGTVQIHLTATEHTISARVVVAQEATRQLIDGQAHQLRQSLAQSGLSLTGFDVSRDGGGSRGGYQPPPTPLPMPSFSAPSSAPRMMTRSASRYAARGGIDILA